MVNTFDSDFDDDAAMEALWQSLAALHPGDVLKSEHNRQLKGYPPGIALEKWGPEIEEMIMSDMERPQKSAAQFLELVRPKETGETE